MYENLTNRSSIYTEQELTLNIGDETSDYTGSLTTHEFETEGKCPIGPKKVYSNSVTDLTKQEPTEYSRQDTSFASEENLEQEHLKPTASTEDINEVISQFENLSSQLDDNEPKSSQAVEYENTIYENVCLGIDNPTYENTVGRQENGTNEPDVASNGPFEKDSHLVSGDSTKEPLPDYELKQIRFSTEVLHTDQNKLEPLKSVDNGSYEPMSATLTSPSSLQETKSREGESPMNSRNVDETDRVDEEINSSVGILEVSDGNNMRAVFNFVEGITAC